MALRLSWLKYIFLKEFNNGKNADNGNEQAEQQYYNTFMREHFCKEVIFRNDQHD